MRSWIVDPSHNHAETMNLVPGFYRAKLHGRDGGYSLVHAEVIEERDEAGDLMADVDYRLRIDGDYVLSWDEQFPHGLQGEPITEAEYHHFLAERAWLRQNWGTEAGRKTDLTTIPPVAPPGM